MDGGRPGTRPEEDEDPAIAAFSGLQGEVAEVVAAIGALRAEVSALGRRLDGVVRQGAGAGAGVPDYSPTLGAMAKELTTIGARLAAVEGKPALALTPAGFEVELARVVRGAAAAAGSELREVTRLAGAAAGELEELVGRVRAQQEQRRWLGVAGGLGVLAGVLLWYGAAALLPWGMGHRIAASVVGGGQWVAGATLMREADPKTWERVVRLSKACADSSTELCEAAMAIRTIPSTGQPPTLPTAPGDARMPPAAAPILPTSRARSGVGR